jgi:DNA-binding LytR/AlgR family response regulator
MPVLKIGIIEDELIIARTIINSLDELGYEHCGPSISYTEAIEMLENDKPDFLLVDINLSGKKDGIHVAEKVNELYKLPFIFLTANTDIITIERAKQVKPHAYIVKPFTKEELFAAIEIAFSNFTGNKEKQVSDRMISYKNKDTMFIKDGYHFHKIVYRDILYMESDHNYVTVFLTHDKKHLIRTPFNEFLETLPPELFMRVHRRYAINIEQVDTLNITEVKIKGTSIPVSKDIREELMKRLGIS